ncbi:hypothetical protein JIN84_18275 [Luteolibacter yonseiensis]|uniref:Uncharacterized protein n=1 Tax=Luteolibacter yonseiensis TaxID=1144680 RepID=A0A934R5W8_9BACT|nr:hypothetical protein [Luteolibacter yonseiensis]MBK1817572.1 hypothetical protein [Luteolibacter yonseiensis]
MAIHLVIRRLLVPKKLQIGYLEASILQVSPEQYSAGVKLSGKVVRIHAPFGDNSPRVTIELKPH